MGTATSEAKVDIRPLKNFVRRQLTADHHLRRLVLVEDDLVPAEEYPGKCKTWIRIMTSSDGQTE